jgi:drug/metabolite transporter (DMT)-like permease
MTATLYALGAIALWASLATLGVALSHIPPFLLTGIALLIGSCVALPVSGYNLRQWQVPVATLGLGVAGLFGYHFLFFMALRSAPAVEANLVNYLWPLLMVVLAPVVLVGVRLRASHIVAAILGFVGAIIAMVGAQPDNSTAGGMFTGWAWGYVPALGSAFVWASYSLLCRRVQPFPTAAIGLFGLVSGLLALVCHWAMEAPVVLTGRDVWLLGVLGLGPLGAAFYLWDMALKQGDVRQIGILSYLTPLASTVLLMLTGQRALTWSVAVAAVLILGGAAIGSRIGRGS